MWSVCSLTQLTLIIITEYVGVFCLNLIQQGQQFASCSSINIYLEFQGGISQYVLLWRFSCTTFLMCPTPNVCACQNQQEFEHTTKTSCPFILISLNLSRITDVERTGLLLSQRIFPLLCSSLSDLFQHYFQVCALFSQTNSQVMSQRRNGIDLCVPCLVQQFSQNFLGEKLLLATLSIMAYYLNCPTYLKI